MPTGPRVIANNVYGTVDDAPLTSGATTLTSTELALLPVVSSAHAVIVLDPKRSTGEPEIIIVTAHTASATVATIVRGAYGTVARSHIAGTPWAHVPVIDDYQRIATSAARPSDPYEGQPIWETDTDFTKYWNGSTWEQGLQVGPWTGFTPTLTQGVTVTKTVTSARFVKIGRTIHWAADLSVTGTGTAATPVAIGIPATALTLNIAAGVGHIFDASAAILYLGQAVLVTTNTVQMWPSADGTVNYLGARAFTAALASGDLIRVSGTYEAAS